VSTDPYKRTPDEVIADGGPLHYVVAAAFAHSGGRYDVLNGADAPSWTPPASFGDVYSTMPETPVDRLARRVARLEARVDAILDEQQRRAVLDDYDRLTAEWDRRHRG